MRILISAVILFALIIGASIGNTVYVDRCVTDLAEAVYSCPSPENNSLRFSPSDMNDFWEKWNECKNILAMSIHYDCIQQVEIQARSMYQYGINAAPQLYAASKDVLLIELYNIKEIESFSFENII